MIRPNSGIYLVSTMPFFDEKSVTPLGKLDEMYTSLLYENLILNHKENLDQIVNNTSITYSFDEKDRNYLPEQLKKDNTINIFGDTENSYQNIKNIVDKYFSTTSINLLVFANSIGFSGTEVKRILDFVETTILQREEDKSNADAGSHSEKN